MLKKYDKAIAAFFALLSVSARFWKKVDNQHPCDDKKGTQYKRQVYFVFENEYTHYGGQHNPYPRPDSVGYPQRNIFEG